MKKLFIFFLQLVSLLLVAIACNQKQTPTTPQSNVIYKSMLLDTPTPDNCGIPTPVVPVPTLALFPDGADNFCTASLNGGNPNFAFDALGPDQTMGATISMHIDIPEGFSDGSDPSKFVVKLQVELPFFSGAPGISVPVCVNGITLDLSIFTPGTANASGQLVTREFPGGSFHQGLNTVALFLPRATSQTSMELSGCLIPAPTNTPGTLTPSATSTFTPTNTPTFTPSPTYTPSLTPTCPGFGYSVPLIPYYQGFIPGGGSEPWAQDDLDGSNDTISVAGCFLTCFSMLAQLNPGALNLDLTAYGAIDDDGDIDQERVANYLGWPAQDVRSADDNSIANALKEGRYIIANVPHHFVVVTGSIFDANTRRCRFTIQDPSGHANAHFLDEYTPLDIRTFGSNGNTTPAK